MRNIIFLLFLMWLAGCAPTPKPPAPAAKPQLPPMPQAPERNVRRSADLVSTAGDTANYIPAPCQNPSTNHLRFADGTNQAEVDFQGSLPLPTGMAPTHFPYLVRSSPGVTVLASSNLTTWTPVSGSTYSPFFRAVR